MSCVRIIQLGLDFRSEEECAKYLNIPVILVEAAANGVLKKARGHSIELISEEECRSRK